ncbi:MAG TPA: hypothetical protein VNC50_22970, partial [Planctomycetia bacterium]|nr:hypothetical protein [Planctomycetia bacterium]
MSRLRSLLAWIFRRWWRAVPFCLFALLALWFAFSLYRRASLRGEKERLLAEIRARGEPVELADYANLSDANDEGLKHLCRAILLLNRETAGYCRDRPQSEPERTILALAGRAPPTWTDSPDDGDWGEINDSLAIASPLLGPALGKVKPAFAELETACQYPPAMFPHDYVTDRPFAIEVPHMQDMRCFSRALRAEMVRALAAGEERKTYPPIILALKAAHLLDREVMHIPKLIQTATAGVAIAMIPDALSAVRPNDQELRALDAVLAEAETFSFRATVLYERAEALKYLEFLEPADLVLRRGSSNVTPFEKWRLRALASFEASWFGEAERLEEQVWLLLKSLGLSEPARFKTRQCADSPFLERSHVRGAAAEDKVGRFE